MSRPEDRRTAPRILSDYPLALFGPDGATLDDRALAHDVSEKGFKAETQASLEPGGRVSFALALEAGEPLRGTARVAWVQTTQFSTWAGAEFLGLTRAERRRVRRALHPGSFDWDAVLGEAALALALILGTLAAGAALRSPFWREILGALFPKAVAAAALGWALLALLKPR